MSKTGYEAKLGPVKMFVPHLIQKTGEDLMKSFGYMAYDHDACGKLAIKVADDLMAFIKTQAFDRYRYVVRVDVVEKRGQAVMYACRALWDNEKDNCLTLRHENQHLIAVGMVFAIYLE